MIWKNFKDEEKARGCYETLKGKKARMLCENDEVIEKDGDKKMTDEMKKYAEKNNYKSFEWRD